MKDFGKAEDPVDARLAPVPVVFSWSYRIEKNDKKKVACVYDTAAWDEGEKGKIKLFFLESLLCHGLLPLFFCVHYIN